MLPLGEMPVFLRVGNGGEYQVGTFSPQAKLSAPGIAGLVTAEVDVAHPLATLLRAIADHLDSQ